MKREIDFVKDLEMGNVIRGEGSSNFSQRIYEKLGFETLLEIQYEDYKQDGEFVFKNTGEHKPEKVYGILFVE